MNKVGLEYGKWLGGMNWDYLATIRPHYSLTPTSSDRMMSNLSKYKSVDSLFFSLERDSNCNMNHLHLMLKTNSTFNRDTLAKSLNLNNKAVGYFDSVLSPEAVSYYCTKHITKQFSHYNFFFS